MTLVNDAQRSKVRQQVLEAILGKMPLSTVCKQSHGSNVCMRIPFISSRDGPG